MVLNTPLDEVYSSLSSIKWSPKQGEELVDAIAVYTVKIKLGRVLGKMFVREVTGGNSKEKNEKEEDVEELIQAAKELDGEVSVLAKNVERVRSSKGASLMGWNVSPTPLSDASDEDEEDEGADSDSSLSQSTFSEETIMDDDDDDEEVDTNMPFTILRALVLYRSIFSSKLVPPTISVEPPTPTIPTPPHRLLNKSLKSSTLTSSISNARASPTMVNNNNNNADEQRRKMYALRKILGSRVFEKDNQDGEDNGEEENEQVIKLEDARDRVVDMLVEAERVGRSTCCGTC